LRPADICHKLNTPDIIMGLQEYAILI